MLASEDAAATPRASAAIAEASAGLTRLLLVAGILLGALAVVLLLTADRGGVDDRAAARPVAADADAASVLLTELTLPGDPVGYLGQRALGLVPGDRVPVAFGAGETALAPRYVVVVTAPGAESATAAAGLADATVLLTLERSAGSVQVLDRGPATTAVPSPSAAAPAPVAATATATVTVTVAAGDHFWAIAERSVTSSLGRAPTVAEVTTYWSSLVEANQDMLIEPGNANLLLVGQQLRLPPT
jgi:LysM repeat protein